MSSGSTTKSFNLRLFGPELPNGLGVTMLLNVVVSSIAVSVFRSVVPARHELEPMITLKSNIRLFVVLDIAP